MRPYSPPTRCHTGPPYSASVAVTSRAVKSCATRFVHVHVVRRDAGLSGVQELAPRDAACGDVQVGGLVHDDGGFAAEFQRDAREGLRGGRHDLAAHGGTAGEEHVIERQGEQVLRDLRVAFHHGDQRRREGLRDDLADDAGRGGRLLARFQDGGVPGGERPDERREAQVQRVVPGLRIR